MCYAPSKLLYLFTGNLDMILLHTQTEDKNWTKNCIKLALVHMYKTRLENLPNHTRDRQTIDRLCQCQTSTSGASWQHQSRNCPVAENCGGFSLHSDSSSRTADSVQKKLAFCCAFGICQTLHLTINCFPQQLQSNHYVLNCSKPRRYQKLRFLIS